MANHFRTRILTPLLILVALLGGAAVVVFSISRVLLAVPEIVATFTALAVAAYVLLIASFVGKEPRLPARTIGTVLVVGVVAVVGAGVVAAQAGIRDLHHEEEHAGEGTGDEEGEGGQGAGTEIVDEIPADAFTWVAADLNFPEAPAEVPAGEVTIAIDNQGALEHNVVFEGIDVKVEAPAGQKGIGTFDLEPGTYTFFCDIPGHREAGMEGTVEVAG